MDEERAHRRPFSLRKIFSGLVLALILVLVGGHFLWGVLAKHNLNVALAKLRAQGEPLTAQQLNLGSMPDAGNASLDYESAAESINTNSPAWKLYDDAHPAYEPPLAADELSNVDVILSQNAAALQRVSTARGKSAGPWNDGDSYADMSTMLNLKLGPERQLCKLLKLAALDAHARGDDEQALCRLDDALAVSDAGEDRPSLVGHLVAIGASALATETLCKVASDLHVGQGGLSRETILQCMARLRDEQPMDAGCKLAWRSDRIMGLNMFLDVANGNTGASGQLPKGKAFGYLTKPFVLADARLYAEHLQGVMLADQATDYPAAQKQYPTKLRVAITGHPMQHLFAGILAPSFEKAVKVDYRARTQRRLATVALAVRLYAADHHDQLPASLNALVPTYLPAIPIDGMSGKPLLFKDNPPRVYSVGDDGVDDGGIPVDPDIPARLNPHGDVVVYLTTQPRKPAR